MKTIPYIFCAMSLFCHCNNNKTSQKKEPQQQTSIDKKKGSFDASNLFVEITFAGGVFKGTHTFYPEKGNVLSQINLELNNDVSTISASKLVSKEGIQIHYFIRHFLGEANQGDYKAKRYTSGCGTLNFIDLNNSKDYKRIDGDFTACTDTEIKTTSLWKSGIVKNKRTVSGNFKETVLLKYTMDNGSTKTETVAILVKFKVKESRRK